jgi:serine/threonine protein kinase
MKEHFEDEGHYCLVMELMEGGELFDMIIEKGHFNETEANKVMAPLFDAVIAAHKNGIVHRDLKPENLLLSDKNLNQATVKISDFGLARYVCPDNNVLASTTCGTPGYVAPEILDNKKYDNRVDYWSLGVVMYIMLSGQPPFFHEDNFELFEMIKEGEFDMSGDIWENNVSDAGKDLIKKLLVVDPDQRLTDENILEHQWVQGQFEPKGEGVAAFTQLQAWQSQRKQNAQNN